MDLILGGTVISKIPKHNVIYFFSAAAATALFSQRGGQAWILAKSMIKYGCRRVPYSCQISTKTSEMNVSARGVFKKSKIIGIGSVEIFLDEFQF